MCYLLCSYSGITLVLCTRYIRSIRLWSFFGGIAQLGEHLICNQKAIGSIPITSTIYVRELFMGNRWEIVKRNKVEPGRILSACGVYQPPIPIYDISKWLGVELKTGKGKQTLTVVGSKAVIFIPDTCKHSRFHIAHSLGHLLMHQGSEFIEDTRKKGFWTDEEREANRYARIILMPRFLVKSSLALVGTVQDMATMFDVPEYVVERRMSELKLI